MDENIYDLKPARKAFSRIGLALCLILVLTLVLQILCIVIPELVWGEDNWLNTSAWGFWLMSFVPLYLAILSGLLVMRKVPAEKPEDHKLSWKAFLVIFPICVCLMYAGNLIGITLSCLLSGGTAENEIAEYAMDNHPMKYIVMVILAPLVEEYLCRKQLIDRTRKYGEKVAVFFSAIVFGLLHGNFFQFFYAFALGLVFGYVYLRTGRLRYTVILHGIINFMGSVIAPWIVSLLDMELLESVTPSLSEEAMLEIYIQILPGLMALMFYAMIMMALSITGLVLLIVFRKKIFWNETREQLPREKSVTAVYLNVGMVLYVLLCVAEFVMALL